jgi:signal transduction histidine kinase
MDMTLGVRFARSEHNRFLYGVAGGIAATLGIDVVFVRLAFVLLSLNFGVGIALYFLAYALSVPTGPTSNNGSEGVLPPRPVTDRHNFGFFLLLLAGLSFTRATAFWVGDGVMIPATFIAMGATVILLRSDSDTQRWETNPLAGIFGSRPSRIRLGVGTLAIAGGVAAFLATNPAADGSERTFIAMSATALGMILIFGPWLTRLGRQLIDERSRTIRTEERAEVGAHLHDSVLQTLAMIQRAESPERMVSLARQQERDLRAWLHGGTPGSQESVRSSLETLATRIDDEYQVPTNIVVVGDRAITDDLRPLVAATQEAITNAARHSGSPAIHVYLEITEEKATALIRDEGRGFDAENVAEDRQGIRESIRGRMRRHGGEASIRSGSGSGTEVELTLAFRKREW